MPSSGRVVRLIGPPQADGEYIALREETSDEEILHLHDYERIYGVPGLYEHIVQDLLGCRSPQAAIDGLARALTRLGINAAEIVLLDVGAGTGMVGELARDLGVRTLVGIDSLEAARGAPQRARPAANRRPRRVHDRRTVDTERQSGRVPNSGQPAPRFRPARLLERSRFRHRLSTVGHPIYYELVVASIGPSTDENAGSSSVASPMPKPG